MNGYNTYRCEVYSIMPCLEVTRVGGSKTYHIYVETNKKARKMAIRRYGKLTGLPQKFLRAKVKKVSE